MHLPANDVNGNEAGLGTRPGHTFNIFLSKLERKKSSESVLSSLEVMPT